MDVTLRFVGGTSNKFYRVRVIGSEVVISYGRWATAGVTYKEDFGTAEKARSEARRTIALKKKRGYYDSDAKDAESFSPEKFKSAMKPPQVANVMKQSPATLPAPISNERSFEL